MLVSILHLSLFTIKISNKLLQISYFTKLELFKTDIVRWDIIIIIDVIFLLS